MSNRTKANFTKYASNNDIITEVAELYKHQRDLYTSPWITNQSLKEITFGHFQELLDQFRQEFRVYGAGFIYAVEFETLGIYIGKRKLFTTNGLSNHWQKYITSSDDVRNLFQRGYKFRLHILEVVIRRDLIKVEKSWIDASIIYSTKNNLGHLRLNQADTRGILIENTIPAKKVNGIPFKAKTIYAEDLL